MGRYDDHSFDELLSLSYAWTGRRLPTEKEWEHAARGGLEDEPFPWSSQTPINYQRSLLPSLCLSVLSSTIDFNTFDSRAHRGSDAVSGKCNGWTGAFPKSNDLVDGYAGTAPVDAYEPNEYGIYNMVGNVWEWTEGGKGNEKPLRGGSYIDTLDGRCVDFLHQT